RPRTPPAHAAAPPPRGDRVVRVALRPCHRRLLPRRRHRCGATRLAGRSRGGPCAGRGGRGLGATRRRRRVRDAPRRRGLRAGRPNYLCPRRWQLFRGSVTTREEARLLLKTLVWRATTLTGDRAELNLLGGESELWSRVSANDESCDARRCRRTPGGCYLQRA